MYSFQFTLTRVATMPIILTCVSQLIIPSQPAMAADQDLIEYAEECDKAIGVSVKEFNCSDGFVLEMDGTEGASCEKPPYLPNSGCYKYSRIGQQEADTDEVGIVFLCRHKEKSTQESTKYNDIAVIQTHYTSGATCFYQQLGKSLEGENVPAPRTGEFWLSPKTVGSPANACVQCHDSGPFIRTPYVMQAKAHISAFEKKNRNKTAYWFPGERFVHWNGRVYQATIEGDKNCSNACHIMGANAVDPNFGTSAWLGLLATGAVPTPHLEGEAGPDGDLAHWMKPPRKVPNEGDIIAATVLASCARGEGVLGCELRPWDGQFRAMILNLEKHPYPPRFFER